MKNKADQTSECPCDSGKSYCNCCQPYLQRVQQAPTAEALMRSRYTAFCLRDEEYLRYSWHPDHCPDNIRLNADTIWLGLKIKKTVAGDDSDTNGHVEFIARSKSVKHGKAHRLHENSRFTRYEQRWVYLMGDISTK